MAGTELEMRGPDGTMRSWIFRPEKEGRWPGAVMFVDAFGVRPAMLDMAERLAGNGYVVLVPDFFHRSVPLRAFSMRDFADDTRREELLAMLATASHEAVRRDAAMVLEYLSAQLFVTERTGCFGYCFGGSRALSVMGAFPERVAAAAVFHASNLASEAPDSPHLLAPRMRGRRLYVGVAGIDLSFPPEEEGRLATALRQAGVEHTIESYDGVRHGFTVADSPVYNRAAAERHWDRLLVHFREALQ